LSPKKNHILFVHEGDNFVSSEQYKVFWLINTRDSDRARVPEGSPVQNSFGFNWIDIKGPTSYQARIESERDFFGATSIVSFKYYTYIGGNVKHLTVSSAYEMAVKKFKVNEDNTIIENWTYI